MDAQANALLNFQSNLAKLGISVQPVGMTFPTEAGLIQNPTSNIDIYAIYTFPPVADPDAAIVGSFDCASRTNGYNGSAYCNPTVDKELHEAAATNDKAKRARLYALVQQQLVADTPALFISNPDWVVALRTWVHGYKYTPSQHETQNVYDISLSRKKASG
jgi:peptide/nickel transport system substrate-binding protein